jgi:dienelactone hydrolase
VNHVRLAVRLLVCIAALAFPAAASAAVPDALATGAYPVTSTTYDAGSIQLQMPGAPGTDPTRGLNQAFTQPLDGNLYYPTTGSGPFPVIVLVHGNHSSCYDGVSLHSGHTRSLELGCTTDVTTSPATLVPGYQSLPNAAGYAYLATNLASHGYVVASVDQDEMMAWQNGDDKGMYSRQQIIAATLDALDRTNAGSPAGDLGRDDLVGRMDLNSIGLMGHSRGGDAVTDFIDYNRTRPAPGRRYDLKAVISIAPVDYERRAPYGVNYATILPLCDGDVSNVQGARFFEASQYVKPDDPFARIQFAVQGTNHDYSNTSWVDDDGVGYSLTPGASTDRYDLACGGSDPATVTGGRSNIPQVPGNIRLTPADQRKTTEAIVDGFLRRYVGGETALDPMMTGETRLPQSACPTDGPGVSCDQLLETNYFAPPTQRRDVVRPDGDNPLTVDAVGGGLTGSGFSNPFKNADGTAPANGYTPAADTAGGYDWCNPEPTQFQNTPPRPTAVKPCPLPDLTGPGGQTNERESAPVNRSYGNQLALAWDHPATLDAAIPGRFGDVTGYKTLALSAAVNFFDTRNVQRTAANASIPQAVTSDFEVVLIDAAGNQHAVSAANASYGTALEPSLGAATVASPLGRRHIVLNEIRIPLSDFSGVDLSSVRKIELRFGTDEVKTGSIQLADVRFQESAAGVQDAVTPDLSKFPSAAPPKNEPVAQAPLLLPPTAAKCTAAAAIATFKKVKLTRRGATASGTATTIRCGNATTKVERVQISIVTSGKKAKFGSAKGTTKWSLSSKTKLAKGRYVVEVRAVDTAGRTAPFDAIARVTVK